MHLPRILTALTLSALALPALAADYLVYTLGDTSAELVTDPYADGKSIDDYRGDTMLFIKSPDNIWLGALEVTEQQAKTMKWINTLTGEGKTAYARAPGPAIPNLPQNILRFPTASELKNAWSDTPLFENTDRERLKERYNLFYGFSTPPADWDTPDPDGRGYYDLLGNVAEYALYALDTGKFIGGCHTTQYNSNKNNFETTPSDNNTCGFRLVYAGQVGKTYTVTVRIGDDDKPVGSYVAGTEVDVSEYLTAPDEDHYIDSVTVEPPTLEISPEGVFAMPAEDVTLTCVVKPYYTVTTVLTYGSEAPVESAAKHKAGDTIALPELKSGYRLCQPPAVSTKTEPPASVATAEDGSFTMPEANVLAEYAAKPYVTLTVTGGTASETEPFMGTSVTLTPKPGAHQVFKSWAVSPTGLTLNGNTLSIPKTGLTPGAAYAATASFETAPRVLVYGGTVTVTAGEDLGNGYYSLGARLLFEADIPSGCKLAGWKTEDETALRTDNAYTVPTDAANTTKTFTAVFEISDTAVGGEATLYFGLDENGAAYGNFGYTADKQTTKASPNTLTAPLYKPRSEQYVLFDLTEKGTLTYADTLPEETSTTSVLPLKRVAPEGGTPFYMGVYETTSAQMAHLQIRCKEPSQNNADLETAKSNTYAYTFDRDTPTAPMEGPFAGDTAEICANFDGQYGLREINTAMRLPHKEEYAAVNNGYDGTTVTEAMVNASDNGANLYERIAQVDTYEAADGFYGMWGNYADSLAASSAKPTVRGQVIGGDAACTYKDCVVSNVYTETRLARICFRPVLPVTEPITITVKIGENKTTVQLLPGKTIVRENEAPVLAGYEFQGWQWSDGTSVTAETTAAAEDDEKTLEAVFTRRTLREIAMTYEGCTGPENLIAGSSTTVYTEGTIDTFTVTEGLTAEPNADGTALTVTAPADSGLTEAKVTVTLKDGTPAKPGYRFRLR